MIVLGTKARPREMICVNCGRPSRDRRESVTLPIGTGLLWTCRNGHVFLTAWTGEIFRAAWEPVSPSDLAEQES